MAYTYDNANRLTQITRGTPTVSLAYDNANRRTSVTLPNGVVMSYGYDNASELSGITYTNGSTTLGALTYSYDLAGRRTSMGGSYATTGMPMLVSSATYNANNQLTQWGTANLYYDENGNMTSDGTNSLSWNARNQLGSMNFGNVSFQYDAYGRRTGKTASSSTTNYLYDGANVAQELSGSSPTANLLSGGIDEAFTRTDSSGTANFLTDALGSAVALTDGSGSTLASYAYEPFGNTTVTSGSSANPYQYTGRENDGTGLYFNRARYYSPTLQRFVSEDPAEFGNGDTNAYPYTMDSPTNLTDPSGKMPVILVIAAVGGALGGINGGITAYNQGGDVGAIIHGTLVGAGSGAITATVATVLAIENPVLAGAELGALNQGMTDLINGRVPDLGRLVTSAGMGAVGGGIAGEFVPQGAGNAILGRLNRLVSGRAVGVALVSLKGLIFPGTAQAQSLGGRKDKFEPALGTN